MNSTLDLRDVLSTIVAKAVQLSGTEAGAIYVFDDLQREFHLRATYGMDQELITALTEQHIRLDEPIVARSWRSPSRSKSPICGRESHRLSTRSSCAPVFAHYWWRRCGAAKTWSACSWSAAETPGAFPQNTVDLMKTFAAQSALAIQNARLFHEIEEKSRQLEEASQHKSQFLANMSHELRTPLNAILGYTELIADGAYGEPSEKMWEVLKRLESNGKHLLGLINDVLDLSKIEAGQLVLVADLLAGRTLPRRFYCAVEPLAADKKLKFTTEVAPTCRGPRRRATFDPGPAQSGRQRDQIHRCWGSRHRGLGGKRRLPRRRSRHRAGHFRRRSSQTVSRSSSRPTIR